MMQLRKGSGFNYEMRKTSEFDKPESYTWKAYKLPNFLEQEIRTKKHVPNVYYNVEGDMVQARHKSGLCRSPRLLVSDEMLNYNKKHGFPGPGAHNPTDNPVRPRILGAFNFKGERDDSSYIGEA
jgi:hypothetical protein